MSLNIHSTLTAQNPTARTADPLGRTGSEGLRVLVRVPDLTVVAPAVAPLAATTTAQSAAAEPPEALDRADEHVSAGLELAARWLVAAKQSAWLAKLPVLAGLIGLGSAWGATLQTAAVLTAAYHRLSRGNWSELKQPRFALAGTVVALVGLWALVMSQQGPVAPSELGEAPLAEIANPATAAPAEGPALELAARPQPVGGPATDAPLAPSWESESSGSANTAADVAPQPSIPTSEPYPPVPIAGTPANSPADLSPIPPAPAWNSTPSFEAPPAAPWTPPAAEAAAPADAGPAMGPALVPPSPAATPESAPFHPSRWSSAPRPERVAARITGVRATPATAANGGATLEGVQQVPLAPSQRLR